jgi:Zn-dependent M28 family amino/carboxypeptidase
MRTKKKIASVLALALLAALLAVGAASAAPGDAAEPTLSASAKLRKAVEPASILVHERRFQRIAIANPNAQGVGTRASGTPGYKASADYVAGKLKKAGYEVSRQSFEFPFFEELEPAQLQQVSPAQKDYETATFEYSGSGDVTGRPVPTEDVLIPPPAQPGSTSGCEPEDFVAASETEPEVALIQRGTCPFAQKAANAEAAGYDAAIIFNEGQEDVPGDDRIGVVEGTLGSPDFSIPVVGASFATGQELYAATQNGAVVVRVFASASSETRKTQNVIADTPGGRADRTVVVGAHLDSVLEGPGINDNGSGSSTILEVALQMSELGIRPENRVRFAFWGAEESGLLGSEHYVANLPERRLDQIALNLNFDMLGSPNYVRFVYDGDGSATPDDPDAPDDAGPAGSAKIERVFNRYFAAKGLATEPTAFDGRSDYGPFIAVGIPAGGLFTGAEDIKTEEEAEIYGGTAGESYDRCYHQACDNITNLSVEALNEMSDGVAHATLTYAEDREVLVGPSSTRTRPSSASDVYEEFKGPHARK